MLNEFSRAELLLGKEAMQKLSSSRVAVFGIGGVGSFAAEALARAGICAIDVFDDDKVCLTNINRQLIALHSTIGKPKVEVMRDRILDINPRAVVTTHALFYSADTADSVDLSVYDYIVDAIDTVSCKLALIERATAAGVPIVSCMGAGNKLDPTRLEVSDIYKTSVCPLARVMRKELKSRGVKKLKVVYSREESIKPADDLSISCKTGCVCPPGTVRKCTARRQVPGSVSFVPPVAGYILAGEVVRDIVAKQAASAGTEIAPEQADMVHSN
ncbi:MAG TPA: tRNA threonylcarbamoyladenosine dehydratase [Clostridia bacterium]|nr:tRNA threonylcarbamoyladenosine dehydratase [Clostridia bacterium]